MKCFSCGGPHYASRCPKTTQEQKDELYSPEAKAKRKELRMKKGVNREEGRQAGSGGGSGQGGEHGQQRKPEQPRPGQRFGGLTEASV